MIGLDLCWLVMFRLAETTLVWYRSRLVLACVSALRRNDRCGIGLDSVRHVSTRGWSDCPCATEGDIHRRTSRMSRQQRQACTLSGHGTAWCALRGEGKTGIPLRGPMGGFCLCVGVCDGAWPSRDSPQFFQLVL
jgi:hypothetical protein